MCSRVAILAIIIVIIMLKGTARLQDQGSNRSNSLA